MGYACVRLQFTDKFMLLLVAAGVLCHVAYGLDKTQPLNLYLGIVLYGIVIITCTMTFLQGVQCAASHSYLPHLGPHLSDGHVCTY